MSSIRPVRLWSSRHLLAEQLRDTPPPLRWIPIIGPTSAVRLSVVCTPRRASMTRRFRFQGQGFAESTYAYVALIDPTAPAASACVSPNTSLPFPVVTVGTSSDETVTVTSCGTEPLSVTGIIAAASVFTIPASKKRLRAADSGGPELHVFRALLTARSRIRHLHAYDSVQRLDARIHRPVWFGRCAAFYNRYPAWRMHAARSRRDSPPAMLCLSLRQRPTQARFPSIAVAFHGMHLAASVHPA